ncbi:MBL fold metallo-hydrolase [Candidatus Fermentibacteria bacterium]|nr:MBL fold metallo-hydrolase [Candidatus Fermentibacteria bacterium]
MRIKTLEVGALPTNCYLIAQDNGDRCMVVDPGGNPEEILRAADRFGWRISLVVNTHCHPDHVASNRRLIEESGAELALHPLDLPLLRRAVDMAEASGFHAEPSPEPDLLLEDGQSLQVGDESLRVLHTPGHSPGSVCLLGEGFALTGDLLFAGSVGRTDLPGGDYDELMCSLSRLCSELGADDRILPGHGPPTDLATEARVNPHIAGIRSSD